MGSTKTTVANTAKSFSRKQAFSLAAAENLLQKKVSGLQTQIIYSPDLAASFLPQLTIVQKQLKDIQEYHVETLTLCSGLRWREASKVSAGFLKRTVQQRQQRTHIAQLKHPDTGVICTSSNDIWMQLLRSTQHSIHQILSMRIPFNKCWMIFHHLFNCLKPLVTQLLKPITFNDLVNSLSRSPKRSSPGLDGIPYSILRLLISHPDCRHIALTVYNDALQFGTFPLSWQDTCVSLLPKKGDLTDLKNWRPISLINTDAKAFTRLLNARFISNAASLINTNQAGFLEERFIADNGLLMKLVMEHARISNSTAICVLIDQEKAYDRINEEWLRRVL